MPNQILKNLFFMTNLIILNLLKNLKMIHQIQKKNLIRKSLNNNKKQIFFHKNYRLNKEIKKFTEEGGDKGGKKIILILYQYRIKNF